eukprot:gb/GECH01000054.1/.p1 GENE.gb/GECH01000054.1/~~gb/GECH01000054.1/.p1  ORF type:complete len:647 (+),score=118.56 gb/GECH01000054.1/:1-1941(+)
MEEPPQHLDTVSACLVRWVNTFEYRCHIKDSSDLIDESVVGSVLYQISPHHFEHVPFHQDDLNQDKRTNRMKHILKAIDAFYDNVLGTGGSPDDPLHNVDATRICEHQDQAETVNLWSLVLGTVLGSDRREEWIDNIVHLDNASQDTLMALMKTVMHQYGIEEDTSPVPPHHNHVIGPLDHSSDPTSDTIDPQGSSRHSSEHNGGPHQHRPSSPPFQAASPNTHAPHASLRQGWQYALEENLSYQEKAERLEKELQQTRFEKDELQEELERVREEKERLAMQAVSSVESQVKENGGDMNQHKNDGNNASEDGTDPGEIGVLEEKEREIERLQTQVRQAEALIGENRELRDELDLVRARAGQVDELESQLKRLTNKLLKMNDHKRKAERYEEQSARLVDQVADLQNQMREMEKQAAHSSSLKKEVASLSQQVEELQSLLDSKETRNQQLEERVAGLTTQRQQLQDRCHKYEQSFSSIEDSKSSNASQSQPSKPLEFVIPPEQEVIEQRLSSVREALQTEKTKKQEIENKFLAKEKENQMLKNELDKTKIDKHDLESSSNRIPSSSSDVYGKMHSTRSVIEAYYKQREHDMQDKITNLEEERQRLTTALYRVGELYLNSSSTDKQSELQSPSKERGQSRINKLRSRIW